jgi:hypothetical protein
VLDSAVGKCLLGIDAVRGGSWDGGPNGRLPDGSTFWLTRGDKNIEARGTYGLVSRGECGKVGKGCLGRLLLRDVSGAFGGAKEGCDRAGAGRFCEDPVVL